MNESIRQCADSGLCFIDVVLPLRPLMTSKEDDDDDDDDEEEEDEGEVVEDWGEVGDVMGEEEGEIAVLSLVVKVRRRGMLSSLLFCCCFFVVVVGFVCGDGW